MTPDTCPALLLNADFRPLGTFPLSLMGWEEAVTAVLTDRVSVVAEYDTWVRSPSTRLRLPSVVALRAYQRRPRKVAFTRYNVFLRDRFTCQYCGVVKPAAALTFDHVLPRACGGRTCWSNIVTACEPCNLAKGDRMVPLPRTAPREPTARELLAARKGYPPQHLHTSWLDFIYWDSELEA